MSPYLRVLCLKPEQEPVVSGVEKGCVTVAAPAGFFFLEVSLSLWKETPIEGATC